MKKFLIMMFSISIILVGCGAKSDSDKPPTDNKVEIQNDMSAEDVLKALDDIYQNTRALDQESNFSFVKVIEMHDVANTNPQVVINTLQGEGVVNLKSGKLSVHSTTPEAITVNGDIMNEKYYEEDVAWTGSKEYYLESYTIDTLKDPHEFIINDEVFDKEAALEADMNTVESKHLTNIDEITRVSNGTIFVNTTQFMDKLGYTKNSSSSLRTYELVSHKIEDKDNSKLITVTIVADDERQELIVVEVNKDGLISSYTYEVISNNDQSINTLNSKEVMNFTY